MKGVHLGENAVCICLVLWTRVLYLVEWLLDEPRMPCSVVGFLFAVWERGDWCMGRLDAMDRHGSCRF